MTIAKLNGIVKTMASNYPFFYSEADFQHSLALALKANGYDVFLEYPITINKKTYHIDIIARNAAGIMFPIELKYKTTALTCQGLTGNHKLRIQSAQDINRFLFWKDVKRLEQLRLASEDKFSRGFVIMLTNDVSYWSLPKTPDCIDKLFRIHSNAVVQDVLWTGNKCINHDYKAGTVTYKHFTLGAQYVVPKWIDYSIVIDKVTQKQNEFKYLTISV